MIIPGYKNSETAKVLDRGGAIRGNRLAVFFSSHQETLKWSIRYFDVKIRY
jgi:3D (Asp-Asp-Asp) domain-containing protein